jgi:hypothetical protein
MTIYTSVWAVLALGLVMLAVVRKVKARSEDDTVHLSSANWSVVEKQQTVAHFMEQMDRWGLILTFVTVAYGLALLAVYLYNIWEQGKNIIY